jgi:hypothetical protein
MSDARVAKVIEADFMKVPLEPERNCWAVHVAAVIQSSRAVVFAREFYDGLSATAGVARRAAFDSFAARLGGPTAKPSVLPGHEWAAPFFERAGYHPPSATRCGTSQGPSLRRKAGGRVVGYFGFPSIFLPHS